MPLPTPTSRQEWVQLAQIRITNILRSRIAANIRQLEVKVSESGPPDKRPQPHILQEALQNLLKAGILRKFTPKGESRQLESIFYTLAAYYPDRTRERVADLLVPYRLHRMLAGTDEYCSRPLEEIARASFNSAGPYEYLGKLPKAAPLDGVYRHSTLMLGLEVKNHREWIYPMTSAVWVMVRKCLELDALPLLVPRKIAYITRAIFARIGVMGFEFYRQVFAPAVAHLLPEIQHTDRLGYKDVVALPPEPYPPLVAFLQTTLPARIAEYRERWAASRELLTEFAINRNLGDPKMTEKERQQHYNEFARALFQGRPEVDEWY